MLPIYHDSTGHVLCSDTEPPYCANCHDCQILLQSTQRSICHNKIQDSRHTYDSAVYLQVLLSCLIFLSDCKSPVHIKFAIDKRFECLSGIICNNWTMSNDPWDDVSQKEEVKAPSWVDIQYPNNTEFITSRECISHWLQAYNFTNTYVNVTSLPAQSLHECFIRWLHSTLDFNNH